MVNLEPSLPIYVLTGFLGSGKTTLLQRLLQAPRMPETAILINEFGEVGLDHRLVAHVKDAGVVIERGCLCCTVRPELRAALIDLLTKRRNGTIPRFSQIIIETSGLSDPAPILNTIRTDYVLNDYFFAASVIATVDAVNGGASLVRHQEVAKQIAIADTLLITKTDLASPDAVSALAERARAINPDARQLDARSPQLALSSLLVPQAERRFPDISATTDTPAHDEAIRSFTLTFEAPIDWSAFAVWLSMLLNRHGENVLRFKGMLNLADQDAPVVVHGVQHIMHAPQHLPRWPSADRRSHLVFITKNIGRDVIEHSLARFLKLAAEASAAKIEAPASQH